MTTESQSVHESFTEGRFARNADVQQITSLIINIGESQKNVEEHTQQQGKAYPTAGRKNTHKLQGRTKPRDSVQQELEPAVSLDGKSLG